MNRRYSFAFLLLMLCALLGVVTARRTGHRKVPPVDGFTEVGSTWTPYGGAWQLDGNTMKNNSDERGAKLLTGDPSWANYAIDADVALLGDYGDAGLIFRVNEPERGVDSYRGFFAGLRSSDNSMILGRADFGWEEYKAMPVPGDLHIGDFYHLRAVAVGCDIAVRLTLGDGTSIAQGVHLSHCERTGLVGIKSYQSPAAWKNFRVSPATPEDVMHLMGGQGLSSSRDGTLHQSAGKVNALGPIRREAQARRMTGHAVSISSVQLRSDPDGAETTLHGVVTLLQPLTYVQDATGGAVIDAPNVPPMAIGDEVEVTGVVHRSSSELRLDRTQVRILGSSGSTTPRLVSAEEVATGLEDHRLVMLTGTLRRSFRGDNGLQSLELESSGEVFLVRAEPNLFGPQAIDYRPGSILQVTGIVRSDPAWAHSMAFAILASPTQDAVVVLHEASWWTPWHVVLVAILSMLLVSACILLVVFLRRQTLLQIVQERELLAHDLHDSISQSLAGIGFQLCAVGRDLPPEALSTRQLDRAQKMVEESHLEIRRSISTLRLELGSMGDLAHALRKCAERFNQEGQLDVFSDTVGKPRHIPLRTADCFFRIGQEAISNAILHANATALLITLDFQPSTITLTVQDNGHGMANAEASQGYGIYGMEKRAAMTEVDFRLESTSAGTTVIVTSFTGRRWKLFNGGFTQGAKKQSP